MPFRDRARAGGRRKPHAATLRMEPLESRELLDASPTLAPTPPDVDADSTFLVSSPIACVAPLELAPAPTELAVAPCDYDRALLTWSPAPTATWL